jgi:hypothetical protein
MLPLRRFPRFTANPDAFAMATHAIVPIAEIANKYLALIDRRRAELTELHDTGRWKIYYSDQELCDRARELTMLRDKWTAVAAMGGNDLPALRRWAEAPARADMMASAAE